jgi:NTE family protein
MSALPPALPVTLALSGGGAKSAAQAGVLSIFEEANIPVSGIAGVSAGGMVGILYGLGYAPAAIRNYIAQTNLLEVWEFDTTQRAIFGAEKVRAHAHSLTGDKTFADLRLPVTALALDLKTEREIHLTTGRLDDAILATMAIPGFFTPVDVNGMTLVDGGVLNPLPVDVARALGERVVAVDVLYDHSPTEPTQIFEARGPLQYAYEIGKRLRLLGMVESVYQSVLIASIRMSEHLLRANPPDVLIRPAVGQVGLFAFDLAGLAYEQGRAAARAALPQLEALTRPTARTRLRTVWRRVSTRFRRRPRSASGR